MKRLISIFLIIISFKSFSQNTEIVQKEKFNFSRFLSKSEIIPFIYITKSREYKTKSINNFFLYGVKLNSNISNNLNFYSSLEFSSKDKLPLIQSYIDSLNIFPGKSEILSKGYNYKFKFNYNISKYFKLEFGRGNSFIGKGKYSLLLTDKLTPYPYLKLQTTFNRIKYTNLFTTFLNYSTENLKRKKYASFHYLEYNLFDFFSIGVFESVIWQGNDENSYRGYDIEYLNPIIFFRPVEFSKASPDNVLLGLNTSISYKDNILYGQIILDDLNIARMPNTSNGFFQNKFGFQIGLKTKNLLNVKNLNFNAEFNQVQPYTYAHKSRLQNYTHFNQSLAHPLGANFKDLFLNIEYAFDKLKVIASTNFSKYGGDSIGTHFGQNIFLSDFDAERDGQQFSYGNFNGQGVPINLSNVYLEFIYPHRNIRFFTLIYIHKKEINDIDKSELNFLLGMRFNTDYNPFSFY